MKILKILNSNDGGGVFTCEIQFIKELAKRNITVDAVILGDGRHLRNYEAVCNRVLRLPSLDAVYGGGGLNVLSSIVRTYNYGVKYSKYVKDYVKEDKYAAVIYRRATYIHLAGKLAGLTGCRVLWHLPGIAAGALSRRYYNYFSNKYHIVQVANSIFTKNTLGSQCRFVVYPGFDEGRVARTSPSYRLKLKIGENVPVYGIPARLQPIKAQDIVVEAFAGSAAARNGAHLLLAGGPLNTDFAQKVKRNAGALLDKQVHFLGEIEDLPAFYSSIDVMINGGRSPEPFGISVAEALGAGVPVIAYDSGGPSEMVKDGVNGWLVKESDVESYRNVLDTAYDQAARWRQMGDRARMDAGRLSVKANVDKLVDIINEVTL